MKQFVKTKAEAVRTFKQIMGKIEPIKYSKRMGHKKKCVICSYARGFTPHTWRVNSYVSVNLLSSIGTIQRPGVSPPVYTSSYRVLKLTRCRNCFGLVTPKYVNLYNERLKHQQGVIPAYWEQAENVKVVVRLSAI